MTTRVVFETAALADCVKKAADIAPQGGGEAFDKAAGIMFEVYPDEETVAVRATDLSVYFIEWLDPIEVEGDDVAWLLPSKLLAGLIKSYPIGSGRTVEMFTAERRVAIESGKSKSQFALIRSDFYPRWEPYDEENMKDVTDLGGRIAQVEWAADKSQPQMGVRITGQHVVATDKYKLAVVPLEVPIDRPITIPPNVLSGVLKARGEAKVRAEENQFFVMPDEHTQLRTTIVDQPYPDVDRIMGLTYPQKLTLQKTEFTGMVNRVTTIGTDRMPTMNLIIGKGEVACMMSDNETGHIGDVVPVDAGQADHKRVTIRINPGWLLEAISNSPGNTFTLQYNPENSKGLIKLEGDSGYMAWIMPLHKPKEQD